MEHPDYPGYLIHNDGRVWSKKTNIWMKFKNDKDGYKHVKLMNKGIPFHLRVHRLVAEVYISNPEEYRQVNHINGNRSDNCVNNLEWVTNDMNHKSINMTRSNFGTVCEVLDKGKLLWRHSVRINKKDVTKQFPTEQECKLYRMLLKYCFYVNEQTKRKDRNRPT